MTLNSDYVRNGELDYHNLSQLVQNGGDAMSIFPRMKDMSAEDEKEARQALLEYCKLDTLAMVRVWEKLQAIFYFRQSR